MTYGHSAFRPNRQQPDTVIHNELLAIRDIDAGEEQQWLSAYPVDTFELWWMLQSFGFIAELGRIQTRLLMEVCLLDGHPSRTTRMTVGKTIFAKYIHLKCS